MEQPLVSCITPTANRLKFIPSAVNYFLNQDYPNKELIIIDDGTQSAQSLIPDDSRVHYYYYTEKIGTIGLKRNLACEKANGEILLHWDDDDWYATDWLSRQVDAQLTSGADITGLNKALFFSPLINQTFLYEDTDDDKPWLCGATMAYKKSFWETHRFVDLQVGEDYDFVWNSGGNIFAMDYLHGFIAILHANNTSIKPIENPNHKKNPVQWAGPETE